MSNANSVQRLALFSIALLVMAFFSFTKGWLSFVMLPVFVVLLPILVLLYMFVNRQLVRGTAHPWLGKAFAALVAALVFVYVSLPGFGDTETVSVFTFFTTRYDSWFVTVLSILDWLVSVAALGLAAAVCVLLYIGPRHPAHTAAATTGPSNVVTPTPPQN